MGVHRKLIAITMRVFEDVSYPERRDALDQKWMDFALTAGVTLVPIVNSLEVAQRLFKEFEFEGAILTGGNDLGYYGGDAPERDEVESFILNYSIKKKMPVFGVCRGMQVMQHYAHGALSLVPNHVATRHKISLYGTERHVNSYHKWGVLKQAEGFEVLAETEDGVIEAMKHQVNSWVGIMWHPEREPSPNKMDVQMLKELFNL